MRMLDCDPGRLCSVIHGVGAEGRLDHLTSRERCRAAVSAALLGETGEVMSLASFSSCLSSAVSVPSRASRIMLTVDSSERRRLEGLDMVVPRLLVLEWPRRCAPATGELGVAGDAGLPGEVMSSNAGEDTRAPSAGDAGPASSASMRSGGRRSFSMSDLRLLCMRCQLKPKSSRHIDLRILKARNCVFDAFGAECESTVRQLSRARYVLEF